MAVLHQYFTQWNFHLWCICGNRYITVNKQVLSLLRFHRNRMMHTEALIFLSSNCSLVAETFFAKYFYFILFYFFAILRSVQCVYYILPPIPNTLYVVTPLLSRCHTIRITLYLLWYVILVCSLLILHTTYI